MRLCAVALALALATIAPASAHAAGKAGTVACPYLPQFKELKRNIEGMPPAAALTALHRYEADPNNDNPEACEAFALDRLMSERERKLVFLASGKTKFFAQAAFRCDAILQGTTKCNGVFEDGTAHPLSGGSRPRRLKDTLKLRIESALPDAQLAGVYLATISGLLDGEPATQIDSTAGEITLKPPASLIAVIAIFRAPPPWSYRKLVWYFE